jgi:uroporphyrin-III C-methyltransferase
VIERGTTAAERGVIGKVANIAALAGAAGLGSPALIVVGEVVGLAKSTFCALPQRRFA